MMNQASPARPKPRAKTLALASLVIIAALLIVGSVSSGVIRHLVQTAPSWLTVYFGFRQRGTAKWTVLPVGLFWLALMIFIWLYLLGWASIVRGHFSAIEIAMTIVVGLASCFAIAQSLFLRSYVRWFVGVPIAITVLALQLAASASASSPASPIIKS
jgi:hypothetical protein